MSPEEFVEAIRTQVRDAAVSDVIRQLQRPSGRRPTEHIRRLSEWFVGLADADQEAVEQVMKMVAHSAVFGLLCVLDGVRAIESGSVKGDLRLTFMKNGKTWIICPSESDQLHDIFNAQS